MLLATIFSGEIAAGLVTVTVLPVVPKEAEEANDQYSVVLSEVKPEPAVPPEPVAKACTVKVSLAVVLVELTDTGKYVILLVPAAIGNE